jgi:hypothetical protein
MAYSGAGGDLRKPDIFTNRNLFPNEKVIGSLHKHCGMVQSFAK